MADRVFKAFKATGKAVVKVSDLDCRMVIDADGPVTVAIVQESGTICMGYHPMGGWFTLIDTRGKDNVENRA